MAQASNSAAAATGINAPGGSITKNSPGIWIAAILAIILLVALTRKRKKKE